MRFVLVALIAAALPLLDSGPAHAQSPYSYPWCARYSPPDSGLSACYFATYAQCLASISGVGGWCERNLVYRGPERPPAAAPRRKHRRHG